MSLDHQNVSIWVLVGHNVSVWALVGHVRDLVGENVSFLIFFGQDACMFSFFGSIVGFFMHMRNILSIEQEIFEIFFRKLADGLASQTTLVFV